MAHCHDWSHSEFGHATFVTLACPKLLSPGLGLREQHLISCFCVNNLPVEALLQRYSIPSSLQKTWTASVRFGVKLWHSNLFWHEHFVAGAPTTQDWIICFSSPLGPSFYASSSESNAILCIGFTKVQFLQSLHGGKVTKTLTPSLYSRRLFEQVKQKESMRLLHSGLSCTWSTPYSSKRSYAYHIMHNPAPQALHIGT